MDRPANAHRGAGRGAFGASARYRAGRAAGSDDAWLRRLHDARLLTRAAPALRIDLVTAIGATYVSSQTTTFAHLAEQIGNIDLIYEAVGHSHFALEALKVLGTNGIFVLTGVPGLQAFIEADPARLMRDMVLKNQVLLGTVNAGPDAFASALRDLDLFRRRWPTVVRTLIAGRYPPEQAPDLILGRPAGIKSVIAFDVSR